LEDLLLAKPTESHFGKIGGKKRMPTAPELTAVMEHQTKKGNAFRRRGHKKGRHFRRKKHAKRGVGRDREGKKEHEGRLRRRRKRGKLGAGTMGEEEPRILKRKKVELF